MTPTDGLLVWNLTDPEAAAVVGHHDGPLAALAVTPQGRVVTAGTNGMLLVWDLTHPSAEHAKVGHHGAAVTALAFTPDGRLLSSSADERVLLWNLDDPGGPSEEVLSPHGQALTTLLSHQLRAWLILAARGPSGPEGEASLDPFAAKRGLLTVLDSLGAASAALLQLPADASDPDVAVRLLVAAAETAQRWRTASAQAADPLAAAGAAVAELLPRLAAAQVPAETRGVYEATLAHEFAWADTTTLASAAAWCALRDQLGANDRDDGGSDEDDDSLRDDGRFLLQLLGVAPTLVR